VCCSRSLSPLSSSTRKPQYTLISTMSNKPKGQWYGGRYYPANNRLNTPYFDQRNNLPISLQPSENRKHGSYQTTFQVNSYIGGPGTSYGPAKMDYNGTSARQGMEFTGNENDITRGGPYEFKMPSRKDQGMYTCWTCNPPRDFNSSQALNSHRGQVGHSGDGAGKPDALG